MDAQPQGRCEPSLFLIMNKLIDVKYVVGAALFFVAAGAFAQKARIAAIDRADSKTADRKMELLRFYEAYELYEDVAFSQLEGLKADTAFDFSLGKEALEKGVTCALRAGNRAGAEGLLDSMLVHGVTSDLLDVWGTRFEVALLLGDDSTVTEMMKPNAWNGRAKADWRAKATKQVQRRDSLRETRTDATLVKFRPSATTPEFGALPFGESVVYVTPGLGMGFGPGEDGWTGMDYNQLGFIQDSDSADRSVAFGEKLTRKDALGGALKGKFHNGPVGLGGADTLLILTQSYEEPMVSEDGLKTYKLRLRFFVKGEEEDWSDSKEVTEEVFAYNDPEYDVCHAALDTAGNLLFSSNRPNGLGGMDLWKSEWKDGKYGEPVNLGKAFNTDDNEVFPFVSSINQLYYSSNGRFGYGGLDVYRQEMNGESLKLMGKPVNSNGDDFAIYVDGAGLGYLSSDREEARDRIYKLHLREVYSVFDLEYITCDSLPVADMPLSVMNRTTNEATTVMTDEEGKASLTCVAGDMLEVVFEGDDTYASLPTLPLTMSEEGTRKVRQDVTYTPRENVAEISFEIEESNEIELTVAFVDGNGTRQEEQEVTVGDFAWGLQQYATYKEFVVDAVGFKTVRVDLRDQSECPRPEVHPITMKKSVDIDMSLVQFDFDKATLRPIGMQELDSVVTYMMDVPYMKLRLEAHTDCRGSNDYNLQLSKDRAQSCHDYIVSKGISSDRIIAEGYGETRLKNECADGVRCTEDQHQENRRTELHPILGN